MSLSLLISEDVITSLTLVLHEDIMTECFFPQIPNHYENFAYVQLLKAIDVFYKNKVSTFYSNIIKDR